MNICLQCNQEIDDKKKFCNKSCAAKYNNSHRILSEETKSKISKSLKDREAKFIETENVKAGRLRAGAKRSEYAIGKLLSDDFESLSVIRKKKRVKMEQDNKCLICDLSEWRGSLLTLEVDHIDGNNMNNSRDNLRALCPNCHSQTETWRGKNSKKVISDELLIEIISVSSSIAEVIRNTNMSKSKTSYNKIRAIMEMNKLSFN
ncbi:putative HNH endonuclease [Erwinia phage pEa_SNUABM_50]|uniref:Putative HNH endonuclease n=1 Tax=Erwinia phage pEa_SNUABM_50 TaxID=2768775 RepID=A0A7L8ZQ73_9CAUD|nr:putative HNH endonuclease [Erwinia phage pEa_SNUABM_50]QXO12685.1 hypothetical protein pEaSNUABM49_00450 [Erwinia phage pEa_SNUABM_49]